LSKKLRQIREIIIAPNALRMMERFAPNEKERLAIRSAITLLGLENANLPPSGVGMGYRVMFMEPPAFRIDVGRFGVLYEFDKRTVWVGSIAAY
jgi:hypothetical protein